MVFTWNMHWNFGEQPTGDEVLSFGSRNSNGKDQVSWTDEKYCHKFTRTQRTLMTARVMEMTT